MASIKMFDYLNLLANNLHQGENKKKFGKLDKYSGENLYNIYLNSNYLTVKLNREYTPDLAKEPKRKQEVDENIRLANDYQPKYHPKDKNDKILHLLTKSMYLLNHCTNQYLKSMHLIRKSASKHSNQIILTDSGVKIYKAPKMYLDKFFRMLDFDYQPFVPIQDTLLPIVQQFRYVINHHKYLKYSGLIIINQVINSHTFRRFTTSMDDNGEPDNQIPMSSLTYFALIFGLLNSFSVYLRNPSGELTVTSNFLDMMNNLMKIDKILAPLFHPKKSENKSKNKNKDNNKQKTDTTKNKANKPDNHKSKKQK